MFIKRFNIFFLLFSLININTQDCSPNLTLEKNDCFNSIISFDMENKKYISGNFAINKNDDMIIQYSYLQHRLFFGLKKDGKYFFKNITNEFEIINQNSDLNILNGYESLNLFVSSTTNINKAKELLLSINVNQSIIELYDFELNEYKIKESISFINNENGIILYNSQILEAKENNVNIYFCMYISDDIEHSTTKLMINKIEFSFSSDNLENLYKSNFLDDIGSTITSSIIIESYNILAIFFINNGNIYINLYNFDLDLINQINFLSDMTQTNEYFLKSCYLKDNFFAILYFQLESDFNFKVFNLIQESESSFNIQEILTFQYAHTLNIDTTLNEFLKINNNRIAFISTSMDNCLYIIFFDLYEDYTKMVFRTYIYNFDNSPYESIKKLSTCLYNGFLAFTVTILPRNYNGDNYFLFL